MNRKFLVRSFSAIIFVGLTAFGVLINSYIFASVFALINLIVLYEYLKLSPGIVLKAPVLIIGFIFYGIHALVLFGNFNRDWMWLNLPLLMTLFLLSFYSRKIPVSEAITAVVYSSMPFSALLFLHTGSPQLSKGFVFIWACFIINWLNDTGAYIIGSLIGKHKLAEKISPNKTWEGTLGGFSFGITGAIIYAQFFSVISLWQWIVFGLIISIFGTIGDLYESALKRKAGVKDSGKLMPGHGGLLDRFDSLLFAAPAVLFYIKMLNVL